MKRTDSANGWIHADPSVIERFAYDPLFQILTVEFKNGGRYYYFGVPESVFETMCSAPSKGQFLVNEIKGAYTYSRAKRRGAVPRSLPVVTRKAVRRGT